MEQSLKRDTVFLCFSQTWTDTNPNKLTIYKQTCMHAQAVCLLVCKSKCKFIWLAFVLASEGGGKGGHCLIKMGHV